MPVLPKSLFVLGAGIRTARVARRLKRPNQAVPAQQATFTGLVEKLAVTAAGRDAGIEARMNYESFRTRIPVRGYEQFAPYIERMKRGESDVLWPGQCSFYAISPATAGPKKWLPVTDQMLAHFRGAGLASLLFYTARVGHSGVFRGRHLFFSGHTALGQIADARPFVAYGGDLGGVLELNLSAAADRHLYEPGAAIAQLRDAPARIQAIVARTRPLDISLLAGLPTGLLLLAEALLDASSAANLETLWPNLECIVHGGLPLAPFADELRRAVGPGANFHEVYPSAEGFIAAQDGDVAAGLRLMSSQGLFFEFLPLRDYDEALPAGLGAKAVPLEGVRAGEDYVLLLTTPAGLSRYVAGDVVRFVSTEPARLIHAGRTQLRLNAFGERVVEKELTDSLVAVCQRHGWTITSFHVAPLFIHSLTGQHRGRHEWWIELKPGTVETPTGPIMAPQLDCELRERNASYEAKRASAGMEPPFVRLVMPGFFAHWMRHHGKWAGQHKMPRSRNDRQIADELSAMAHFNAD